MKSRLAIDFIAYLISVKTFSEFPESGSSLVQSLLETFGTIVEAKTVDVSRSFWEGLK